MRFNKMIKSALIFSIIIFPFTGYASTIEMRGEISGQYQYFKKSPFRSDQASDNLSVSFKPELYYALSDSKNSIRFAPFFRLDENDSERTHFDIRELNWHIVKESWELTIGINRVFWGVTESIHLVNIINQTDNIESPDGEEQLGQSMINLTFLQNWGVLDLFILPGFRERTFPGRLGRPGSNLLVSTDEANYESSAEDLHTDVALRWSHSLGNWDIGIAHFYGTSRSPRFDLAMFTVNNHGEPELVPIYDIIHQTGTDIQGTFEGLLLKLEVICRSGQDENFYAAATGFEYTFFDLMSTGMDIGIIVEYLYDERDTESMNDDVAFGARFSLNDIQSTELLAFTAQDIDNHSRYFVVEASRRIGNAFRFSIEYRGVENVADGDPLALIQADNYLQIEFGYFF